MYLPRDRSLRLPTIMGVSRRVSCPFRTTAAVPCCRQRWPSGRTKIFSKRRHEVRRVLWPPYDDRRRALCVGSAGQGQNDRHLLDLAPRSPASQIWQLVTVIEASAEALTLSPSRLFSPTTASRTSGASSMCPLGVPWPVNSVQNKPYGAAGW